MKNLKRGDKVQRIDESHTGIIIDLVGHRAMVEMEDGFVEEILISQLVKVEQIKYEIDESMDKNLSTYVEIRKEKVLEIDLHIENLFIHWKKLPKEKILEKQLGAFKEEMYLAQREGYDKLIVIHGKGKGILKDAVIDALGSFRSKSYQSMDYGKYKGAAIEIFL